MCCNYGAIEAHLSWKFHYVQHNENMENNSALKQGVVKVLINYSFTDIWITPYSGTIGVKCGETKTALN